MRVIVRFMEHPPHGLLVLPGFTQASPASIDYVLQESIHPAEAEDIS
jgi:hypothetical protein